MAQTDSGSIRVLAADSAGLAIGDAKVDLVNIATAFRLTRNTSSDGNATFTPLPAGDYTVEVSKAGFQQTKVNDVMLNVDECKLVFETRQKNNTFLDSNRTVPAYTFNGNFTTEAMADLLMGSVYQFDANTQAVVEQLQKVYAGYVQDDWKVSRNVTLNLGMRYEYTTPYYGARPNMNINFDSRPGNSSPPRIPATTRSMPTIRTLDRHSVWRGRLSLKRW
jgi:hypothetical protein